MPETKGFQEELGTVSLKRFSALQSKLEAVLRERDEERKNLQATISQLNHFQVLQSGQLARVKQKHDSERQNSAITKQACAQKIEEVQQEMRRLQLQISEQGNHEAKAKQLEQDLREHKEVSGELLASKDRIIYKFNQALDDLRTQQSQSHSKSGSVQSQLEQILSSKVQLEQEHASLQHQHLRTNAVHAALKTRHDSVKNQFEALRKEHASLRESQS